MSSEKNKESLSDENLDEIINKIAKGSKKNKQTSSEDDEIEYDNIDFNKLDNDTRKIYTDLFSGMPDIYKVIGVSSKETQEVIKKKCNEKLAKYHPDKIGPILSKYPPESRTKEKKRLEMQYKLIREAYSILRDPQKRKYYDLQKNTIDNKNFVHQKSSFEEFTKLQESEINDQTRKLAENNFKMNFIEIDKKHGFDRNTLEDDPLSKKDIDKRLQDLMMEREQQDIEYIPSNIFEGKSFNTSEFNKSWEKQKRKDARKSKSKISDGSVILWDGISAANDVGIGGSVDYISVNNNYEDLYANENSNSSIFASKIDLESDNDDDFSESSDDDIDVSYTTNFNKNKDNVMERFKEYEQSRKLDDDIYEKREFGDKSWKNVMENPMNISSQMGNHIGKDIKMIEGGKIKKHINKDMIEAYKQLVYENEKKII